VWDDRAERDARGLVALLFVAGGTLRRADLAEALHYSQARLGRACDFLRTSPPHGLVLLEHADQLQLVTAPDVGKLVEAFLHVDPPAALSQAALEVLAIVAYEQPVSRSDVAHVRGTDSAGVIDSLLARKLIADDTRFGGRGRPSFLVYHRPLPAGHAARLARGDAIESGDQLTLEQPSRRHSPHRMQQHTAISRLLTLRLMESASGCPSACRRPDVQMSERNTRPKLVCNCQEMVGVLGDRMARKLDYKAGLRGPARVY
jgi:segregation and condensation protein B